MRISLTFTTVLFSLPPLPPYSILCMIFIYFHVYFNYFKQYTYASVSHVAIPIFSSHALGHKKDECHSITKRPHCTRWQKPSSLPIPSTLHHFICKLICCLISSLLSLPSWEHRLFLRYLCDARA